MTEESAAVTISHPPDAMLRLINPVLRFVLGTPLAGAAGEQMMVVNVTGRKSGKRYSIPVTAHHIDGTLYALTSAPWKNNFKGGASAEVLHRRKTTTMRGELITDPATVGELAHRCADSYGAKRAQRLMGMKFRDNRVPSVEEFSEAATRLHVAAVKLTPEG
jgi:hypothetical protein